MRYDERVEICDSKKRIFCFIRRAERNLFGFTKDRSFVIDLKWLFRQPIRPARRFTPTEGGDYDPPIGNRVYFSQIMKSHY
jgi:hypothetical protein